MSARPIAIAAVVDPCERPVLERAARRLGAALEAAGRPPAEVRVTFFDSLAAAAAGDAPDFVVASLLPDLWRDEPVSAVEARWRAALQAVPSAWPPVLVCTIFRHVDPGMPPDRREALRERIRRLALCAIEISHDTGANVIDLDRTLAHVGGRPLASDCRFQSDAAIEVGARTVVRAILALGQDAAIDPDVAARTETLMGAPWDLAPAPAA